jgi:hypothetical protein
MFTETEHQSFEYYALEVNVPAGDYALHYGERIEYYRVGEYGTVAFVTGDHVESTRQGYVRLANEVEHPIPEGLDRELVLLRITDAMFDLYSA